MVIIFLMDVICFFFFFPSLFYHVVLCEFDATLVLSIRTSLVVLLNLKFFLMKDLNIQLQSFGNEC